MYNSPFKWWVQSVMPVVFDDSLSYYEVLAKLTKYIEGLTGDVQEIEKVLETIDGIEDVAEFTKFLETIQAEIGNLNNLQTDSKNNLVNAINEVALKANIAYKKPPSGIPESDLDQSVRDKLNNSGGSTTDNYIINNVTLKKAPNNNSPVDLGLGTYSVPEGGIPWDTLSDDVKTRINSGGGGTGGTKDYTELINKPQINGHTLNAGNNTLENLGIGTYNKPEGGIPESDLDAEVQEKLNTSGNIADSESAFVATRDYEAGELIYIDGVLYKTKYRILNGTNLIPGNNIEVTDISNEIARINGEIDALQSGSGPDSWSLSATLTTARRTNFFEYFNAIGNESYLFIIDPVSSNPSHYYYEYILRVCKRDGTEVLNYRPGSSDAAKLQQRVTFTPVDTGEYYCTLEPYSSSYSDISTYRITLEYTESQGISELWTQVNKASQVEPRVGALETLVGEQQTQLEELNNIPEKVETLETDVDNLNSTLDDSNFALSSLLITKGTYQEQTVSMTQDQYIYCVADTDPNSVYNGQVNNSTNDAYVVISVRYGEIYKISARCENFKPLLVYLNSPTPSRSAYVGHGELVSVNTIYTDYYFAVPFGIEYVGINTHNYSAYPIKVKKLVATEKVDKLFQAGYQNYDAVKSRMTIDGTISSETITKVDGKYIYTSDGSSYNGQVNNSSDTEYCVIPVNAGEIYYISAYPDENMQIAVWLSDATPSINTYIGCYEFISVRTIYDKHKVVIPNGVPYMGVNTRNKTNFPIKVYKFNPTVFASNLYDANNYQPTITPLTNMFKDFGMIDLFLNVGCIGDSLASGESCSNQGGTVEYHDIYKYSWGQFLARKTGNTYYNFSKGGLTTKTWLQSEYATLCYDGNHDCQAYIIGLGQNDYNQSIPIGTIADIDMTDYHNNGDTFYGNYGKIIQKIFEIVPKAKVFVITDFKYEVENAGYNTAIRTIASTFSNVYLMDMYAYGQGIYEYIRKVSRSGHYGAYGYKVCANAIASYVDWIVNSNVSEFSQVEFIDTEWEWT